MNLSSAYISDPGPARSQNEDACLINQEAGCFLLADGMGGGPDGKLASQIVCSVTFEQLQRGRSLEEAVLGAHTALRMDCTRRTGSTQAGATLVALVVRDDRFELAWVGDSRIYRFNQKLVLLTADHSVVEGLLASGAISPAEADDHPYRNSLTQVLGKTDPENLEIETMSGRIHARERFLLCSDGLYGKLTNDEISDTLTRRLPADETAQTLVNKALDRKTDDNLTALIVDVDDCTG
ncbi:MAG: serine/threonine-protein phosphatase [Wenzhouxiangella sp.]|nr:MAG: serine/threonine-protein phosphatase [Wenzhouxiangella sp.]